jgi:hypothetical protein
MFGNGTEVLKLLSAQTHGQRSLTDAKGVNILHYLLYAPFQSELQVTSRFDGLRQHDDGNLQNTLRRIHFMYIHDHDSSLAIHER